jgi:hypothetical protein
MKNRLASLFLLVPLVFTVAAAGFQKGNVNPEDLELAKKKFSIRGKVLDKMTLKSIGQAFVTLRTVEGFVAQVAYTDWQGVFEMQRISPRTYFIEVKQDGYRTVRQEIVLAFGVHPRQRVTIELEPLEGAAATVTENGETVSLASLNIPKKARKEFEKGLEELNEKNQPDKSIEHFQKAIEIYPAYDEAGAPIAGECLESPRGGAASY